MATQDVNTRKSPAAMARSLERVVRPAPTERPLERRNGGHGLRRGNDGRCRREGANEAGDEPEGMAG